MDSNVSCTIIWVRHSMHNDISTSHYLDRGIPNRKPRAWKQCIPLRYSSKTATPVVTDLQRPNGVGLWGGRSQDKGYTLFLIDTGFEQAPDNARANETVQTSRGFNGFGESSLYMVRDDDGCFEPSSGPWSVKPMLPASNGIQDGSIDVHTSTELLFFCDGTGLWIWSIPLVRPIGLVSVSCTQVSLPQTTGLSTVYVLA
jgi:hypothetical protein